MIVVTKPLASYSVRAVQSELLACPPSGTATVTLRQHFLCKAEMQSCMAGMGFVALLAKIEYFQRLINVKRPNGHSVGTSDHQRQYHPNQTLEERNNGGTILMRSLWAGLSLVI